MGIALSEIPAVGALLPAERRELARWLRTQVARGAHIASEQLQSALDASPFAPVTCATLAGLGWLDVSPEGLSADTFARRIAAGAIDGARMSMEEAFALASSVHGRVEAVAGLLGGVRILRVVLYGSAVRSVGNLKPDVGELDLAVELDVVDAGLAQRLRALKAEQRWRAAIVESGWAEHLMQGDDRVTLAGSLARVLTLFNRQLHGLDVPDDGRLPALVTIWATGASEPDVAAVPPALYVGEPDEVGSCPLPLYQSLTYIEAQTLATQERGQTMARVRRECAHLQNS